MPDEKQNILKGADEAHVTRATTFQFEDVRALAAKMLRNANTQAQAFLDTARREAEGIQKKAFDEGLAAGREEGYPKGYEEGLAAGEAKGREEIIQQAAGITDTAGVFLDALQNERLELANAAEVDLLRLAFDIARMVVRHELSVSPETIRDTVMAAVEMTVSRTDITLFVNPADLECVETYLPEIRRRFADVTRIAVAPDPGVEPGGARAATHDGEVDLRIDAQFAAIERALLGQTDAAATADGDGA